MIKELKHHKQFNPTPKQVCYLWDLWILKITCSFLICLICHHCSLILQWSRRRSHVPNHHSEDPTPRLVIRLLFNREEKRHFKIFSANNHSSYKCLTRWIMYLLSWGSISPRLPPSWKRPQISWAGENQVTWHSWTDT